MLSDIRNDVFVEALIKRWRPYNDFVRFSGDCVYSRKLNRVASVDTPVDGSNMKIELVNSDEFEIIKEKAISICVGKKGIGTQEVTVQILGDSFVNGAFFRDALLSKNYIPGIKLVGLRNIKNEEGQYDEGRGGWTVKKYFEIPKGEMTSYHGYMQPVGEYRYWGSCEFWKNCYKVINGELTDTEIVYNCGRYDQCITKFDKETGYLAAPKKNDLMYDNARGSYMVYTEKKWKNVEVDERKWAFNYRKYLDMWNLDAPKFFAQMLGLNDYRDSLTADYREWNKKIAEMKESYYKAVPDGKFIILIPCTTCGSLNNIRGDFTLRQNAAMWQLRKNIIDTFDGRESEGYYVVDIGITIDNEKGYNRNPRAETMSLKQKDFVLAAKSMGASHTEIIFKHIIPNMSASIIVAGSLGVAGAILTESSLSFLGLGVQLPQSSWGSMLQLAQKYILDRPSMAVFPGLLILFTVLSFNIIGDVLRNALEPKMIK